MTLGTSWGIALLAEQCELMWWNLSKKVAATCQLER